MHGFDVGLLHHLSHTHAHAHTRTHNNFRPDNLDVDPTTGHVYVAGIGKLVSFLLHKSPFIPTSVKDRYLKLHSIAARILKRAASDENIYYGRPYTVETLVSDGSGRLKAVSGVSADERRGFMLLGTLYGHGVANCKLGNGGK